LKEIKEITVFSIGDSNELKTWSNVPYFFTKSLEEKQIKVNRINIEENRILKVIYKYTLFVIFKLINKNSDHTYFRSHLNYFLTNLKIRAAIKYYDKADVLLFLTYSFSTKNIPGKKVVLFSDWSYLYYIKKFLKREPQWFEQKALSLEKKHIEQADTVLSLFPKSLQFNKANYNNIHLYYLGNVINGNYPLNIKHLIHQKLKSQKLLFIGNKKYIHGALDLINTFKIIAEKAEIKVELHMIGINENDTGIKIPGLFYHGYLDKGIQAQNAHYYKLVSDARVIINTNPDWGAFSAMTEAMYYFTPVITTPYPEFTETYGTDNDFGYYVTNNSSEELISKIKSILNHSTEKQIELMNKAHQKVKDFTWSSYTEKFLNIMNE
jgi:glycosyltransferase involved in cell wall biosynthesis